MSFIDRNEDISLVDMRPTSLGCDLHTKTVIEPIERGEETTKEKRQPCSTILCEFAD